MGVRIRSAPLSRCAPSPVGLLVVLTVGGRSQLRAGNSPPQAQQVDARGAHLCALLGGCARAAWTRTTSVAFRVRHYPLAWRGCGELPDGALHAVALAAALLRGNRVVVGRPWLEALEAHAERRVLMTMVQPDRISRRLAQVPRIGAVVHDAVVHVRAPRVVGGPPDDGEVIGGRLEVGPLGDLDALGFPGRRKYLRGGGGQKAGDCGRGRQPQQQSLHGCSRRTRVLSSAPPLSYRISW